MRYRRIIMDVDTSAVVDEARASSSRSGRDALEEEVAQVLLALPDVFKMIMHRGQDMEAPGEGHWLGEAQTRVLYALKSGPRLTSDLARKFSVSDPTMTRIVDALVEKDLVARSRDPEDRRCVYLRLTERGAEATKAAHDQLVLKLTRFLSPLSESQLADIITAGRHMISLTRTLPCRATDQDAPTPGGTAPDHHRGERENGLGV